MYVCKYAVVLVWYILSINHFSYDYICKEKKKIVISLKEIDFSQTYFLKLRKLLDDFYATDCIQI
jgi:hypothetical protein